MKGDILNHVITLLAANPFAAAWRFLKSSRNEQKALPPPDEPTNKDETVVDEPGISDHSMKRRADGSDEQTIAALETRIGQLETKYNEAARQCEEGLKRLADENSALGQKVESLIKQLTEIDEKFSAKVEELEKRLSPGWKRVMPWVASLVVLLLLGGLAFGVWGATFAPATQETQIVSISKELEDAKADFERRLSRLNDVDADHGQRLDRLDGAISDFARRLDSAKTDFERRLARIESSLGADRPRRDRPPLCEYYEWSR
jgi:predicted  nucleic acid-binding Zn-ribbon protein